MQLHNAKNDEDIKVLFAMDEAPDLLITTGIRKPVSHLTISDRFNPSATLFNYQLMAKAKVEVDQFCEGLNILGFLKAMRVTPNIFESDFTQIVPNLTQEVLVLLINVFMYSMHIRRSIHFL